MYKVKIKQKRATGRYIIQRIFYIFGRKLLQLPAQQLLTKFSFYITKGLQQLSPNS